MVDRSTPEAGARPPDPRRLIPELSEEERRQRPPEVRPLTFEDMVSPTHHFRDVRFLIPIESVRAGDDQVFAARWPRRPREPVIDLDGLAEYPSVRSVAVSSGLRASRPLAHVEELLLLLSTIVPEARTFECLLGLRRLWAGWAGLDGSRGRLDVSALPGALQALGVGRHHLPGGVADLARLTDLCDLHLFHCWPGDTVRPLAGLVRLERLRADAPSGWAALRECVALHDVSMIQPRFADLRPFRSWAGLRRLTITGSGVRSLAGVEAFAALERLRLVMMRIDDLAPLRGLPRLGEVELTGLDRVRDLEVLATLPALRALRVAQAGADHRDIIHVPTLRPLAAARALETLSLPGTVVDDGDLAPLVTLPALRRLEVFGDLDSAVQEFRRARSDVEVVWHEAPAPPAGVQVGPVLVRPPVAGSATWWIREDLTRLLGTRTNADAETRLRRAIAAEDADLLARLEFDTEADAVHVAARREDDLHAVAHLIERLAARSAP